MKGIDIKKYMLEYGTWTGITLISFAIMLFFLGAHYENSTSTQIINALIQFSGITIACLAFKKANSNTITWVETRKIGTGISLIIAILSIVYTLLLTNFLEPEGTIHNGTISRLKLEKKTLVSTWGFKFLFNKSFTFR